jgi:hypothetical protein
MTNELFTDHTASNRRREKSLDTGDTTSAREQISDYAICMKKDNDIERYSASYPASKHRAECSLAI